MDKNDDKRQSDMATSAGPGQLDAVDRLLQRWQRLAEQLTPLVGERGFCVLYGRAAGLMLPQYGWLTVTPPCNSTASLIGALRADFASVDASTADACNTALFTTFTKLLTALIGEALTNRLLASASTEQKHVQEHK
ncbi:MAG TPA: hypothetical protein VGD30_03005 [Telluria sp.]